MEVKKQGHGRGEIRGMVTVKVGAREYGHSRGESKGTEAGYKRDLRKQGDSRGGSSGAGPQ